MEIKDVKSLSVIRIKYAKDSIEEAHILLDTGKYKGAANRSYYSIFHAMRAVLAFDGIDNKKHSGVISNFRKLYIKTNIFPTKLSDIITDLFFIRTNSDYKDFYVISKKEIKQQIKNAEFFIKEIEKYLSTKK